MNKKLNKILFLFLLFLFFSLIVLIHRNWLFGLSPLISGDWPYFFSLDLKLWYPIHDLWIGYDGLGRPMAQTNFALLLSIYSILAKMGFDFSLISRLLFFYPVVIAAPISVYMLSQKLLKHNYSSLMASIIYTLNTYFMVIKNGHMHLSVAYSFAPFATLMVISKSKYKAIYYSLIVFLISLYEFRSTLLVIGFSLGFYYFIDEDGPVKKLKFTLKFLMLFALLSAYWVLPQANTDLQTISGSILDPKPLNWLEMLDVFTLHHPFWGNEGLTDFIFHKPIVWQYLIPISALSALLFMRKTLAHNKLAIFCLVSFLAFSTLALQLNGPLSSSYVKINNYVPLLSAYRESTKLFLNIALVFALLIAILFEGLIAKNKKFSSIFALLILAGVVLPILPIINGHRKKTFINSQVSTEQLKLNEFLTKNDGKFSRNLWVSRPPKFIETTNMKPQVNALSFGNYWNKEYGSSKALDFIEFTNLESLLQITSVSNVVVAKDDINTDFYHLNEYPASYYSEKLSKAFGEEPIDISGSKVWKINGYIDEQIYVPNEVISVEGGLSNFMGNIQTNKTAVLDEKDYQGEIVTNYEVNPYSLEKITIESNKINSLLNRNDYNDFELYEKVALGNERKIDSSDLSFILDGLDGQNVLINSNISKANFPVVGDCNNYDGTTKSRNRIGGEIIDDALRVTAERHTACFSYKIKEFDKNFNYLFEFDFKKKSGTSPQLTLFPYFGIDKSRPYIPENDGEWKRYKVLWNSYDFTDEMSLITYLPTTDGILSESYFKNFKLTKIPKFKPRYLKTNNNLNKTIDVSVNKINETKYKVTLDAIDKDRLLVLNQSFHTNWIAKNIKLNRTIDRKNHIKVNDFANGWVLVPTDICGKQTCDESIDLIIEFTPQRWFYVGGIISLTTLTGVVGYLGYGFIKSRRTAKRSGGRAGGDEVGIDAPTLPKAIQHATRPGRATVGQAGSHSTRPPVFRRKIQ